MSNKMKPELLAPAGDIEKLKIAVEYGADAVYIGGEKYGLRANAGNFGIEQIRDGIEYAHNKNAKIYVAVNIFAHNQDLDELPEYVAKLAEIGADALIVSDPGVFQIVKETAPGIDIHISTQANVTNRKAVEFWHKLGASRVVLSRELSFAEISDIRSSISDDMLIECFVHGAMCLSYSGRCYLSRYMSGRDANAGDCSQPCRWNYALVEEKREGEYFPVYEDKRGSYILNSKDMCMIGHIPELTAAGVGSFKIEGRMKSAYYVASTVKAYRSGIDDYYGCPRKYFDNIGKYRAETEKTSHRQYFTGFYSGDGDNGQNTDSSSYTRGYDYVALVTGYDEKTQLAEVSQRNKFTTGDKLEALCQGGGGFSFTVTEILDEDGKLLDSAPHAEQRLKIRVPEKLCKYNMLRRAHC